MDERTKKKKAALNAEAVKRELSGDLIGGIAVRRQAIALGQPTGGDLYELGMRQATALRYDDARKTFDILLNAAPHVPEVALEAGRLARIGGDRARARAILDASLGKYPDHPAVLSERIACREAEPSHIRRAEAIAMDESQSRSPRQSLAFALATHFDNVGEHAKAWHFATVGNGLYKECGPSVADDRAFIEKAFALNQSVTPLSASETAPRPVYLIGPPRSGGTLLQTVLSAPSEHASIGERGALLPWLFSSVEDNSEWQRAESVRQADLNGMRSLASGAKRVIDKTPHHAHVAGLVAKLHRGAVFIDQRRDLGDTLVSIYLQGFKPVYGYSRDTASIADYLLLHRETITRWQEAGLPVVVHNHEAFVREPGKVGKELFDRLEWPWSEDYLSAKARSGDVRTFSMESVRDEITSARSGKFERYRDLIGDLPDSFEDMRRSTTEAGRRRPGST